MSKALLPFYVLYVGDGSTTAFTLDVSKDPFYFGQETTTFDATFEFIPNVAALSPQFDEKLEPSNVYNLDSHNIAHNANYTVSSSSIDGYKITFTLGSAPANGTLFTVQGFISY